MQTAKNSVTYNKRSFKCRAEHGGWKGHLKVPGKKVWYTRALALGVVGKMPISVLMPTRVRSGELSEPEIQLYCELGFFKVLWENWSLYQEIVRKQLCHSGLWMKKKYSLRICKHGSVLQIKLYNPPGPGTLNTINTKINHKSVIPLGHLAGAHPKTSTRPQKALTCVPTENQFTTQN